MAQGSHALLVFAAGEVWDAGCEIRRCRLPKERPRRLTIA
jgi:hypothetical protein